MTEPAVGGQRRTDDADRIAAARFRHRLRRQRTQRWTIGTAAVLAVVAAYVVVSYLPVTNNVLLPRPSGIAGELAGSITDGTLLHAVLASLFRVVVGYCVGCACAVVVGSLRGWFRLVGYAVDPLIDSLRHVPALAYIPLVILWFGVGEPARILVIATASFLNCVVAVAAGMKEVPMVYSDAAQTLGASRAQVFWTIALPSSVPYIFAGLRTGLGAAWGTLVAAELVAAQSGLGYLLEFGQEFFKTAIVIIALVLIGVLGLLMDLALRALQARLARWAPRDR